MHGRGTHSISRGSFIHSGDIVELSHSCSLLPSSRNLTCLWSCSGSISMLLAGVSCTFFTYGNFEW